MKKRITLVLLIILCTSIISGCTNLDYDKDGQTVYNYEDVKDTLIRFHVIANSDTDEDQSLKLKVRDEVINYLYPYLKDSDSIEKSRSILLENENKVKEIANKVITDNAIIIMLKLSYLMRIFQRSLMVI